MIVDVYLGRGILHPTAGCIFLPIMFWETFLMRGTPEKRWSTSIVERVWCVLQEDCRYRRTHASRNTRRTPQQKRGNTGIVGISAASVNLA